MRPRPRNPLDFMSNAGTGRLRGMEVTRLRLNDGVKLAAYQSGSGVDTGPAVVLLHGIGMSHLTWAHVQPMLAGTARVVSFDLPGFGVTPKPRRPLDVEGFEEAVSGALDQLGIGRRVLVGHSMGAQFAVQHAVRCPDLVAGVVLIGPVADPARRTPAAQAFDLGLDTLREPPRVNVRVLTDYLRGGVGWYLSVLRPMLEFPIEDRIAETVCPVVVIRGERDAVARQEWCAQLAERAPTAAQLISVPGKAHGVPLTAPQAVAEAVTALLTRPQERTTSA